MEKTQRIAFFSITALYSFSILLITVLLHVAPHPIGFAVWALPYMAGGEASWQGTIWNRLHLHTPGNFNLNYMKFAKDPATPSTGE